MNWLYFENTYFKGIFVSVGETNNLYRTHLAIYEDKESGEKITIERGDFGMVLKAWNTRPATEAEVGKYLLFIIE